MAGIGVAAFLAVIGILHTFRVIPGGIPATALLILCITAGAIFAADISLARVHLRGSTGLDFGRGSPSLSRTGRKLAGLAGSLLFLAAIYWIAPEYRGDFYAPFYEMLRLLLPFWLLAAPAYFYFVDSRMREPRDGYWHMGSALLLRLDEVDGGILLQHLLGWAVKGFFLPLMFVYFCGSLEFVLKLDPSSLTSFGTWYDFLYEFVFFVDVGLACMGYLMAFRITDTHLRSAEPTVAGWLAALICYEPFFALIGSKYLAYSGDLAWGDWLAAYPLLYVLWGSAILALITVYVWATVMFGARFSNLTHRGIITSGPYRWTRHPAYVAKNVSWWMISVPFIAQGSPNEALRHCLMLLGLNAVYYLRAKTEERHLSSDPTYREYSRYIERNGIFRNLSGAFRSRLRAP